MNVNFLSVTISSPSEKSNRILNPRFRAKILSLILFILIFSLGSNCNPFDPEKENNDSQAMAVFALIAGTNSSGSNSGSEPLETRPYRQRSITLLQDKSLHVYDYNSDQVVSIYESDTGTKDDTLTGINQIFPSGTGRYSFAEIGGNLRIVDSTINLSPHGAHFHYDRYNYYRTIAENRINGINGITNAGFHSINSKLGWASIFYKGLNGNPSLVRFLDEEKIPSASSTSPLTPINGPSGIGTGLEGYSLMISARNNQYLALISTTGTTQPDTLKVYSSPMDTVTWTETLPSSPSSISIDCSGKTFHGIRHNSIPSSNADFTQLESGYNKIHYVLVSCGSSLSIIRHDDSAVTNKTTLHTIDTGGREFPHILPLQNNSNIERGGKDAQGIFLANTGGIGGVEKSSFFVISAEDKTLTEVSTAKYRFNHIGSDTRLGQNVQILSNDGKIISYDWKTSNLLRELPSQIPTGDISNNQVQFHTTWDASFVLHNQSIHEYNTSQSHKARVIPTNQNQLDINFNIYSAPGSDYEGEAH